jgi:hypothetical protein
VITVVWKFEAPCWRHWRTTSKTSNIPAIAAASAQTRFMQVTVDFAYK